MNKKILILLIISILTSGIASANDAMLKEFTGFESESLFIPAVKNDSDKVNGKEDFVRPVEDKTRKTNTIAPIKRVRLLIKKHQKLRRERNSELAPTDPDAGIYSKETETSDFASKELEENFDENMMPDGFEADEEAVAENKKTKHLWNRKNKQEQKEEAKNTENIILDCEHMNYDTNTYCIYANGNANVEFVEQQTTLKADKITYDRMNNTIKAEGNVRIIKNGQTTTGDYIFVDMNEENALIENPVTETAIVSIKAEKGYVFGDKITQENGSLTVNQSFPIEFHPRRGIRNDIMISPKDQTMTNDMENGLIHIKANYLQITQKGDLEVLRIKKADIYKGKKKVLKIPRMRVYTNKNHDFVETNIWELGSRQDLGAFIGPGFVFGLPKGSVLKAIPMLNYNRKIGVGVIGRFQSGTNFTQAGYGTAKSKLLIRGEQMLDDNLRLQYAMNDYMDEWFLGARRPKYGINLMYDKEYKADSFLLKNQTSTYRNRFDIGYYHDIDRDKYYRDLRSSNIGTLRARYMGEIAQTFINYRNEDAQKMFVLDLNAELSAALYGTGDTQFIGRLGPRARMQYKRWMQEVFYYQSVYNDNTPLQAFDAYRYGKSNLYLREYFRVCKYLTVAWFGSINLSGDSPSKYRFQENGFYVSIGPSDIKLNLGYDFVRENTFFGVEMMLDAKKTHIDYDKLVIKQDKKAKKEEKLEDESENTAFKNTDKAPVLQRAVVEDIKTIEDVL